MMSVHAAHGRSGARTAAAISRAWLTIGRECREGERELNWRMGRAMSCPRRGVWKPSHVVAVAIVTAMHTP